jgi:hypothetical protein
MNTMMRLTSGSNDHHDDVASKFRLSAWAYNRYLSMVCSYDSKGLPIIGEVTLSSSDRTQADKYMAMALESGANCHKFH